jgi:hypothetical protein
MKPLQIADSRTGSGGTLDVANITTYFDLTVNNANWTDTINNATTFCLTKVKAMTGSEYFWFKYKITYYMARYLFTLFIQIK